AYAIAVYAAQIFVASWLGEKMLGIGSGVGPAIGRLALGLAVLRVLRMVPYVGFFIGVLIAVWGLGALALAIHRSMRTQVATACKKILPVPASTRENPHPAKAG